MRRESAHEWDKQRRTGGVQRTKRRQMRRASSKWRPMEQGSSGDLNEAVENPGGLVGVEEEEDWVTWLSGRGS